MENKKTIEIEISDIEMLYKIVDSAYVETSRDFIYGVIGYCEGRGCCELAKLFEYVGKKCQEADYGNK